MSESERYGCSILMHLPVSLNQQVETAAAPLPDLTRAKTRQRFHIYSKQISVIGINLSISIDVSICAKKKSIENVKYYMKLASYMILMSQAL